MKLTENAVLSRTRQDTLAAVKKLNCWGCELSDISIVERMINVEVLSLSKNCISSLASFAYCKKLRELYLRENKVVNLDELQHLQMLGNLEILWLSDNPCSTANPTYRQSVISTLPNLKNLDSIEALLVLETVIIYFDLDVTPEEVRSVQQQQQQHAQSTPAVAQPASPSEDPWLTGNMQQSTYATRIATAPSTLQRSASPVPGTPYQYPRSVSTENISAITTMEQAIYMAPAPQMMMSVQAQPAYFIDYSQPINNNRTHVPRASQNVLAAIVTLLDDLDADALQLVIREAYARLNQ